MKSGSINLRQCLGEVNRSSHVQENSWGGWRHKSGFQTLQWILQAGRGSWECLGAVTIISNGTSAVPRLLKWETAHPKGRSCISSLIYSFTSSAGPGPTVCFISLLGGYPLPSSFLAYEDTEWGSLGISDSLELTWPNTWGSSEGIRGKSFYSSPRPS